MKLFVYQHISLASRRGLRPLLLVAVVAVCAVTLAGCGLFSGSGDTAGADTLLPAVEAVPARFGGLPLEEELSGVVRARNQVVIRAEISGAVVEVTARNGDTVARGQVLVRLDDSRLREQLRQAEANARLAAATASEARAQVAEIEADAKRTRALARDALVSELMLETREAQLAAAEAQAAQAEARVDQARAVVEERKADLARSVVRARTAGRVGQRDVEVGMVVDAGAPLFLLGDFQDLVVEVPLTQRMLRSVSEGTPVEIGTRDVEAEPFLASVSRISPFLEESSFSTEAEIDVPDGGRGLRPGMFVTVRVLYGSSRQATLVPASAVWENPGTGEPTVFVIEDSGGLSEPSSPVMDIPDTARATSMRTVEVLAEGRGQVGIRGVEAGEWVVTLGQHLLYRGFQTGGVEGSVARVRPTSWESVLGLQELRREDLLAAFLAKQRQLAKALGAELPESPEAADAALRDAGVARETPATVN